MCQTLSQYKSAQLHCLLFTYALLHQQRVWHDISQTEELMQFRWIRRDGVFNVYLFQIVLCNSSTQLYLLPMHLSFTIIYFTPMWSKQKEKNQATHSIISQAIAKNYCSVSVAQQKGHTVDLCNGIIIFSVFFYACYIYLNIQFASRIDIVPELLIVYLWPYLYRSDLGI